MGPRIEGASMPYVVVRIFLDLKCEVVRKEYGFSKLENIIHELR